MSFNVIDETVQEKLNKLYRDTRQSDDFENYHEDLFHVNIKALELINRSWFSTYCTAFLCVLGFFMGSPLLTAFTIMFGLFTIVYSYQAIKAIDHYYGRLTDDERTDGVRSMYSVSKHGMWVNALLMAALIFFS